MTSNDIWPPWKTKWIICSPSTTYCTYQVWTTSHAHTYTWHTHTHTRTHTHIHIHTHTRQHHRIDSFGLRQGQGITRKSNDVVIPCQYEKKLWTEEFQHSEYCSWPEMARSLRDCSGEWFVPTKNLNGLHTDFHFCSDQTYIYCTHLVSSSSNYYWTWDIVHCFFCWPQNYLLPTWKTIRIIYALWGTYIPSSGNSYFLEFIMFTRFLYFDLWWPQMTFYLHEKQ